MGADDELVRGRDAGRRLAWVEAHAALSRAGQASLLVGGDLELLAAAAYLLGHVEQCRRALQRARHAQVEAGDLRRAVRCVFWVAFTLLLQGDLARAGGWLARANRLLERQQQDCAEHGLLLLPVVVQAAAVGDYATAQASAARAAKIGARFGDADHRLNPPQPPAANVPAGAGSQAGLFGRPQAGSRVPDPPRGGPRGGAVRSRE